MDKVNDFNKDKKNLKITNPASYNEHVTNLVLAIRHMMRCSLFYKLNCGNDGPNIPQPEIPPFIQPPPTTDHMDWWNTFTENYKYPDDTGQTYIRVGQYGAQVAVYSLWAAATISSCGASTGVGAGAKIGRSLVGVP